MAESTFGEGCCLFLERDVPAAVELSRGLSAESMLVEGHHVHLEIPKCTALVLSTGSRLSCI